MTRNAPRPRIADWNIMRKIFEAPEKPLDFSMTWSWVSPKERFTVPQRSATRPDMPRAFRTSAFRRLDSMMAKRWLPFSADFRLAALTLMSVAMVSRKMMNAPTSVATPMSGWIRKQMATWIGRKGRSAKAADRRRDEVPDLVGRGRLEAVAGQAAPERHADHRPKTWGG